MQIGGKEADDGSYAAGFLWGNGAGYGGVLCGESGVGERGGTLSWDLRGVGVGSLGGLVEWAGLWWWEGGLWVLIMVAWKGGEF